MLSALPIADTLAETSVTGATALSASAATFGRW
jgi:hypothetical protein